MRFLIDSNLSARVSCWSGSSFEYVYDLDASWTDDQVWHYALQHGLIIVTKDADFYHWAFSRELAPKIVQFKVGNMRLAEWVQFIEATWPLVTSSLLNGSIVQIFKDRVEVLR